METRAITFRKLKEICGCTFYEANDVMCCHVYSETNAKCNSKNCPVWAKLRRGDDDLHKK
jgi:hypothetical protein